MKKIIGYRVLFGEMIEDCGGFPTFGIWNHPSMQPLSKIYFLTKEEAIKTGNKILLSDREFGEVGLLEVYEVGELKLANS